MEVDCYYQDETFRWIQNIKCTPWKATSGGKTLKAQDTQAFNTYTAYELTYNVNIKTAGYVEFKYRKDSRSSLFTNGEFKFAINNKEVLVDYRIANQTGGDWQVFRANISNSGMYTLTWIYTKFSEKNATEVMSAEIEYIRVTGMEYSPKQCLNCKHGWSQPGANKCSLCGTNHYIEEG